MCSETGFKVMIAQYSVLYCLYMDTASEKSGYKATLRLVILDCRNICVRARKKNQYLPSHASNISVIK